MAFTGRACAELPAALPVALHPASRQRAGAMTFAWLSSSPDVSPRVPAAPSSAILHLSPHRRSSSFGTAVDATHAIYALAARAAVRPPLPSSRPYPTGKPSYHYHLYQPTSASATFVAIFTRDRVLLAQPQTTDDSVANLHRRSRRLWMTLSPSTIDVVPLLLLLPPPSM